MARCQSGSCAHSHVFASGAAIVRCGLAYENQARCIFAVANAITQKIRKARTDPEPLPETIEGLVARPEARNLVGIYAALAGISAEAVVAQFAGKGFGGFKPALAELAVSHLTPITVEMSRLLADPAEIDRVLGDGANRAADLAEPILAETYGKVGFLRSRG